MYSRIAAMSVQSLIFTLISFLSIGISFGNDLARGFNDEIDWYSFEDGKNIAKEQGKPIFLLIHKSWCGACKALKPKFATSKEIQELSKHFVMVNCQDDEEPEGFEYSPDGGYIPRILFLDSEGNVQKEHYNEAGNPSYKYYYPAVEDIATSMKKAAKMQEKEEL